MPCPRAAEQTPRFTGQGPGVSQTLWSPDLHERAQPRGGRVGMATSLNSLSNDLLKTSKIQFTGKTVRLENSLEACYWELCTWGLQLKDNRPEMKVLFPKQSTLTSRSANFLYFLIYFPFSPSNGKHAWFYFLHSFFCSPAP